MFERIFDTLSPIDITYILVTSAMTHMYEGVLSVSQYFINWIAILRKDTKSSKKTHIFFLYSDFSFHLSKEIFWYISVF